MISVGLNVQDLDPGHLSDGAHDLVNDVLPPALAEVGHTLDQGLQVTLSWHRPDATGRKYGTCKRRSKDTSLPASFAVFVIGDSIVTPVAKP
jgi:hypothetical protein